MLPETSLLFKIIQSAPDGALWIISSDSWEKIRDIFPVVVQHDLPYWEIAVSKSNREAICSEIRQHDLGEKIVHMELVSKEGVKLFHSYDRMSIITINNSFNIGFDAIEEYPDMEIYLE